MAPQPAQMPIEQALQYIGRQIDAGQLAPAETALRQILQQQPRNAFALHLLGVLAHRAGHAEKAIELIEKAITYQPTVAQFHSNVGEMCRLLGRLDDAVAHGEAAVRLDPNQASAHSNLGIAHYDREEYDAAEACQRRALELEPNQLQALNNLGSIHREREEKETAIEYFRKVLALAPGYLEASNNLGAVLTELERPEEAIPELLKVIRANPGYADAHSNMGNALLLLERFDEAEAAYRQTLALTPQSVSGWMGLARALKEQDRLEEAREAVDRVFALEPDKAEAHSLLGDICSKDEKYDEAEAEFRRAMELDPELAGAHLGMGQLQLELGRMKEACVSFERAMAIKPDDISPHMFMAQARKMKADDPSLARLEAEAEKIDTLPPTKALSLHFSLGKAYDDLKEYDKAFPHFIAGCRLKRARIEYDADDFDRACANIRSFFSRETIERLRGAGDPSDVPIFVLGMPRSGTTLTETIIASHPDVHGAGELHDLLAIAGKPRENGESPGYPVSLQDITHADLTAMGARYVAGVRARNAEALHITDKMPANFLAVGLIHLILPNAKIIHIKRNAADICLSGLNKLFHTNTQLHSYDMTEMGHYYVNYARLMEHWREVLPADAFYEVQYEELVADKEAQTRKLIDYCGLEWNDACLESHKTSRSIKTASITQVRQPVYTSSVERWRHYENYLGPLLEALGEYAPPRG